MTAAQSPAPEEVEDNHDPVVDEEYIPPPPAPLPLRPAPQPSMAQTPLKITETVLPGQQSRLMTQGRPLPGAVPHPSKAASEFLAGILNSPEQRKRTAAWQIQVRRLGPAVYRGRRLNTTDHLGDGFCLMSTKDLQEEIRNSFGGGKYRAEVRDEGGGWQTSWDFGIDTAGYPPVIVGGSQPLDEHSNGDVMTPEQRELHAVKVEEAKSKAKRDTEREEMRLQREREEYEEEKRKRAEARDASPALKAIQDQIAEGNRRFEKLFEMQMQQHRELLTALTAKKDDGGGFAAVMPLLIESIKGGRAEQIEITKSNNEAAKENAKLAAEAMKSSAESQLKSMENSRNSDKEWMQLLLKDAKPKDSIGDVMKAMQLVESIRDRFGPEEMIPQEGESVLGTLAKHLLPVLAGFATRAGTPGAAAAGAAIGLPPGQAPNAGQLPQLADALAPLLLERLRASNPQLAGGAQAALPPPSNLPTMGSTTAEIPPAATGGVVNLDPATPQVAPQATPQVPAPAAEAQFTPVKEDDLTGSNPAERLREMVGTTVQIMLGDARDQRHEVTWVDDALRFWNGQFLNNIVVAASDADRISMIGQHVDPIVWKTLLDMLQDMNSPSQKVIYKAFIDGLHALVVEHRKRMQ